eukprot:CAMPEP_0119401132 /NCGR_PEP_ID=MMETSP1334-20130426/142217_1 /TAXON_ID=127549 /ORGANISM="Calcidiscus leptoporus, Strain RCC1130" /LENGTH=459 /DNA_ID=CAMNT_0007425043 /DNA_START=140 /DNA_END=1522 /DNA_ORIENTATION=+
MGAGAWPRRLATPASTKRMTCAAAEAQCSTWCLRIYAENHCIVCECQACAWCGAGATGDQVISEVTKAPPPPPVVDARAHTEAEARGEAASRSPPPPPAPRPLICNHNDVGEGCAEWCSALNCRLCRCNRCAVCSIAPPSFPPLAANALSMPSERNPRTPAERARGKPAAATTAAPPGTALQAHQSAATKSSEHRVSLPPPSPRPPPPPPPPQASPPLPPPIFAAPPAPFSLPKLELPTLGKLELAIPALPELTAEPLTMPKPTLEWPKLNVELPLPKVPTLAGGAGGESDAESGKAEGTSREVGGKSVDEVGGKAVGMDELLLRSKAERQQLMDAEGGSYLGAAWRAEKGAVAGLFGRPAPPPPPPPASPSSTAAAAAATFADAATATPAASKGAAPTATAHRPATPLQACRTRAGGGVHLLQGVVQRKQLQRVRVFPAKLIRAEEYTSDGHPRTARQ